LSSRLIEIFEDEKLVIKIKKRLPYLFQLAEIESSRAGRIGMEVGSIREKIIVALLIYKFGEINIETEIPITAPEVDLLLSGKPVSVKTFTGKRFSGVKIAWTVDAQKSREFRENYYPKCDILLVQINWDNIGGFYYIPVEAQKSLFDKIDGKKYIKLPKKGTNPRGIEITKDALLNLLNDYKTKKIEINWQKTKIDLNPYKRWIDIWKEV